MDLVVDIFREIVSKVSKNITCKLQEVNKNIKGVFYEHGHYVEILNTLSNAENSPTRFDKKYPLIALIEDIRYRTSPNGFKEANFDLIICYNTIDMAVSQDRYKEVINPILIPIYDELIRQIGLSGKFANYTFPHDMITRPYYGVEQQKGNGTNANRGNIFTDMLDAIEIRNMRLNLYNNNC